MIISRLSPSPLLSFLSRQLFHYSTTTSVWFPCAFVQLSADFADSLTFLLITAPSHFTVLSRSVLPKDVQTSLQRGYVPRPPVTSHQIPLLPAAAEVVAWRHGQDEEATYREHLRQRKIAMQQRFMDNSRVEPTEHDDDTPLALAGAPIYKQTHVRKARNRRLTHGRKSYVSY